MPFGVNDEVLFGAEDEVLDEPVAPAGGPNRGRKYVPEAQRRARNQAKLEREHPITGRMFPELVEPTENFDPLAAQLQGNADAGAVMANLIPDMTVNLPSHLAGFAGKVVGQVGQNFDQSIDPSAMRERWSNFIPRTPRNERGDQVMGEALLPAVEAWRENVSPVLERYPLLGAAADTAGTALEGAGWALGLRGGLNALEGVGTRARAADLSHKPYTSAPVADVAKRYTVLPADAQQSAGMVNQGNITGSTRASFGASVVDSEVPIKNVTTMTGNIAREFPHRLQDANGRIDEGLLRGALDAEALPYQQVAVLPTPEANTLANRVQAAWQARGGSLKGDAVAEARLAPLMDVNAAPVPTSELLTRWREVNDYASRLRKEVGGGSAAAQIKSRDLRSIADSILDEIDQRAVDFGAPDLVPGLKQARVNIGRLHALDDSLDNVGWVDPAKLIAMADNSEPLTGALAQAAADAKAAKRSLGAMGPAVDAVATDNVMDRFGRTPRSFSQLAVGKLFGNKLARGGIEALNEELRAGSGLLKQPVPERGLMYPPNTGPQMPSDGTEGMLRGPRTAAPPAQPRGRTAGSSANPLMSQATQVSDDLVPEQPAFSLADEFAAPAAPDATAQMLQQLAQQNPNMTIAELLALLNQGQ